MRNPDDKYLLPSRRLVADMNRLYRETYQDMSRVLDEQMLRAGPESRVLALRASMGEQAPSDQFGPRSME